MPIIDGCWYPRLFDKQFEIFNSTKRCILASGPRFSGKTFGVLHKIIRHAWETPGARVAVFSKTLKNAKDGGVWDDIIKVILPEWLNSGMGVRFTTLTAEGVPGPKVDGQTRTPFFKITNQHGGESEFKLFSLDHDEDVEDKVKEQRFSCIYFSELTKFRSRKILSITLPQLRMPHLRMDQHFWISDTNPGEDGEEEWAYKVWYVEKNMENPPETAKTSEEILAFREYQDNLHLVEIMPEENPYLDPRQLRELKSTYAYDPDLYSRYVLGKWILGKGARGRHFSGYFIQEQHVLGSAEGLDSAEWETIIPSDNCFELITGWDPGETNHSAHLIERIGDPTKSVYCVLDEEVIIDEEISHGEFGKRVLEKIEALEKLSKKTFLLHRSWSDRSAIERYSATADTFPYLEIHAATRGRVFLQGTPKAPGSVRMRVRIVKQLLAQRRLVVSAHCKATIEMLKFLRRGETEETYVIPDKHKHPFDSLTYPLIMELSEELQIHSANANVGNASGYVAIPLQPTV